MKININLPLTGKTKKEIVELNEYFVSNFNSDIIFSSNGAYPHITLLMGEVKEEYIESISKEIALITKHKKIDSIQLSTLYKPSISSSYHFIKIGNPKEIISLRKSIYERINQTIELSDHGGVHTEPHITVAYTESFQGDISTTCFKATNWSPEAVAISKVGNKGTCIEQIYSTKIN